jgi:hypothetical protein
MSAGRAFFVDPDESGSSASVATAPVLGHVRRACEQCRAEWHLPQSNCPKCGGLSFTEEYVRGTLLERIGDKIRGVAIPEKPKTMPLDPADVLVFERCAAAARDYAAALQAAADVARRAVNETPSPQMSFLQDRLFAVSGTIGDFSAQNMTSSMVVPALGVANLIDTSLAQHLEETSK